MTKIFITGGAGFIGANLAAHYLSQGKSVTIYDNLSRPGVTNNLTWLHQTYLKKLLKIIEADVRDFDRLKPSVQGHDLVFHFAGQTAVTTSITNSRHDFEVNALGTFNLLEAIRLTNPKATVVYSSTNKVYGDIARINTKRRGKRYYSIESASIDESEPINFYSPYGCSKGTGDQYMHDYYRIYGINTIIFRQSCIYGAHQFGVEDQGWVAHFTAQAIKNKPITIYGDGKQVRDMLYITDLVRAYDLATQHLSITAGQIYNIGGGIRNTISLLELLDLLQALLGRPITTTTKAQRLGDQRVYISNIDKAKRDFDWQPEVSVPDGVNFLFTWLNEFLTA